MFDWLINAAYYVIPFIVLLGILVFVHELGHFLTARICGVRVAEFSIGFGKKLWGFTDKSGTEWKLCAVPLGGYAVRRRESAHQTCHADRLQPDGRAVYPRRAEHRPAPAR